jgi:hypothetical protein
VYIYKGLLIVRDIVVVCVNLWLRFVLFWSGLVCFFCNDLVKFLILVSEKPEKTRIYI